jgi:hypothetical protein
MGVLSIHHSPTVPGVPILYLDSDLEPKEEEVLLCRLCTLPETRNERKYSSSNAKPQVYPPFLRFCDPLLNCSHHKIRTYESAVFRIRIQA